MEAFSSGSKFFSQFFLLSSDWFPANLSPRFSRESRDEARLRSGIVGIKSRWGEKKDLLLQREIQNSFSHPPISVETDPFKRVSEFEPKLILTRNCCLLFSFPFLFLCECKPRSRFRRPIPASLLFRKRSLLSRLENTVIRTGTIF